MNYKVAIDLCYYNAIHTGGKDEVAYNLLRGFEELGVSKEIVCFCRRPLKPIIRNISPNVGIHIVPRIRTHGLFSEFVAWFRFAYEKFYAKKMGVKVLLFTGKPSAKMEYPMCTIEIPHDIQVFEKNKIPGVDYSEEQYNKLTSQIKDDFKYRDHIIAISDFDKQEMIKFMPWAETKIHRIYNPIKFSEEVVDRTVQKEYITVLNIQWPHKNVETVLKAFNLIADKTDLKLILVGKAPNDSSIIENFNNFINVNKLDNKVIFTGFVDDEKLNEIINKTRVYVNASYFEGFGMTAVEMMGKKIPTIVAKTTAMPETTRGLCRYYEPANNYQKLAEVMLEEIMNPTSEEQLEIISKEMKEVYSYKKIAEEYWEYFNQCINE